MIILTWIQPIEVFDFCWKVLCLKPLVHKTCMLACTWRFTTQFIVIFTSEITSCRKRKGGFLRSASVRRGLRTIQVSVCKSFCVTSQYAISFCLCNDNSQITLVAAKFHKKILFPCCRCYYDPFHSMGLLLALDPLVVTSLPSLQTCVNNDDKAPMNC